jgi:subtilisin-like proprotein convertase family protein
MKLKAAVLALASALSLVTGTANAAIVTSTNVPVTICDLCTVSSTLNFGSHLTLTDVNVRLSNLTHTFVGDLLITLISPRGTSVVLSDKRGGSGDNFRNTVFDDEAGRAIADGSAPFTGSFRPDGLLSAFDGQDAFGTWTLRVEDQAFIDSGSINSWGLELTGTANNVPEPTSLALSALALAGLAAARRRRAA